MSTLNFKGFLSEEIPSHEHFELEENLFPLDLNFIISGISSIPLYERLGVKKELLSEEEIKLMNLQGEQYKVYKECEVKKNIPEDKSELYEEKSSNSEALYFKDNENSGRFLKYFYNCPESDPLITKLLENSSYAENTEECDEEHLFDGDSTPTEKFLDFFLDTLDGKHDSFIIHKTVALNDTCSDVSSEEQDEISANKVKELTCKLQFCKSSSTRDLEHILSSEKPDLFKLISTSPFENPTLQMKGIFHSESESEKEIKHSQKKSLCKEDNPSKELIHYLVKKGKRSSKKTKPKPVVKESNDCNINKLHNKQILMQKKTKEKTSTMHDTVNHFSNFNVKGSIQTTSSERPENESIDAGKSVMASVDLLSDAKSNVLKNTKKSSKNNESSNSSDEEWQNLAEKNLYLRSKRLEQKVAKKKK